ncbi:MAG: GNAT family N-acetyltransferase [Chloroflexi bacterium]|nr:GNAT family N-acetyltransferase [Chloroflexota bacterium]
MTASENEQGLEIVPLTPERWADLERLFGPHGADSGCWCMFFRLPYKQFDQQRGEANRKAFQQIVESGTEPGLIAYVGGTPAGWVAVAPRAEYGRVCRSRILKPVDDREGVWSVVCFFIDKAYRKQGLSTRLLKAAVQFAAGKGAQVVEGYPVDLTGRVSDDASAYHGTLSSFVDAGFVEVARRSPARPVMRYWISEKE